MKLHPDTPPRQRPVLYLRERSLPVLALALAAQRVLGMRPGKARKRRGNDRQMKLEEQS